MSEYKISGYTTTRNVIEMDYPFEEAIRSMLDFCDEVVVVDSSDGQDGTMKKLEAMMNEDEKLFVYHVNIPWDAPNHGIYDGQTKALARSKCTGDYLWQQDVDEIAEKGIRFKIENLLSNAAAHMDEAPVICLPVVEYWGSIDKVRVDVNPWKGRISKNVPYVTHGIPRQFRKFENDLLYAHRGTDGCDYIHTETGDPIVCSNFVSKEVEEMRIAALQDPAALLQYSSWFNMIIPHLPTVYHYSWFSIESKILKFKHFWNGSWLTLYNEQKEEGWNPFFADKSLDDVSDEEIKALAKKLETETGGHIFHAPWDGRNTPSVTLESKQPTIIEAWCKRHKE